MKLKGLTHDSESRKKAQEMALKIQEVMAATRQAGLKDPKMQEAIKQAQELQMRAMELNRVANDQNTKDQAEDLQQKAGQALAEALKKAEDPEVQAQAEKYLKDFAHNPETQMKAQETAKGMIAEAGRKAMSKPKLKETFEKAMAYEAAA